MASIVLYGTSVCHLCEDAERLLVNILPAKGYIKLDIADSQHLFDKYGECIPVVKRDDGRELEWPFDMQTLHKFLLGEEEKEHAI